MNRSVCTSLFTAVLLMLPLVLPMESAMASKSRFTIVMMVWRGCEEACKGFQDYIRQRDIPADILIRDANRDRSRLPEFVTEAKNRNVDLVVTWGTSVTRGVVGSIDQTDPAEHITQIPVVFMIVADPIGAGIIKIVESSGRENITGTLNRAPEEVQIKAIRAYRPFRKLGVLFNRNELNSVLNADAIDALARKEGFELVSYEFPLGADGKPAVDQMPDAISTMERANVDFIYVGSSSFLMANRDRLIKEATARGLPIATAYAAMASESGALIAVASRYYNVGKLAGFQAEQVLINRIRPIEVPIRNLSRFSYIVNMEAAHRLGMYPPLDVLRYAEVVE